MTPEDLARFRSGDPTLFRALVTDHSPHLLGVARGFALDLDEAHDLVQETWMRVYAKRRSYRGGSFASWLFTVCRRVCLSAVRSRPQRLDADVVPETIEDPAAGDAPLAAAVRREVRTEIARALFELPTRQREVVIHRLVEGLSTRETATVMACAEGTVKAALHQALAKLSEPLRAHAPPPPVTAEPSIGVM